MTQMYNTKTFTEIYDTATDFTTDYSTIALGGISDSTLVSKLYYLLYAKYGNSPIANLDETQFKYKLFSTIFMYGPAWEKRLSIQTNIRALTADDIIQGSKAIHDHAYNPGETSSETIVDGKTELTYINEQNVSRFNKSKMDAYEQLWSLISTDVTEEFLAKFKPLFQKAVNLKPFLYESEE